MCGRLSDMFSGALKSSAYQFSHVRLDAQLGNGTIVRLIDPLGPVCLLGRNDQNDMAVPDQICVGGTCADHIRVLRANFIDLKWFSPMFLDSHRSVVNGGRAPAVTDN